MSDSTECVFCSSALRELTFLESSGFRSIYNKAPILPGHSMIISKQHINSLLEMNDEERSELMRLSVRTAEVLKDIFEADSFNWTIQDRPPAGQTVPHFHLHIIPRKNDDLPNPGDWYPALADQYDQTGTRSENRNDLTQEELQQITRQIKTYLTKHEISIFIE